MSIDVSNPSQSEPFLTFPSQNAIIVVNSKFNEENQLHWIIAYNTDKTEFYLFKLHDLIEAVKEKYGQDSSTIADKLGNDALQDMPSFLTKFKANTKVASQSDFAMTRKFAALEKHPKKAFVIVDDAGNAVGVVSTGTGMGPNRDLDPKPELDYLPKKKTTLINPGPDTNPDTNPDTDIEPIEVDPRLVNVELLDDDYNKLDPEEAPLKANTNYTISFFVDAVVSKNNISTDMIDFSKDKKFFRDESGEVLDEVDLEIQLMSEDFDIGEEKQKFTVPRTGKSRKARFDITPQKDGPATLQAIFLRDGTFVQIMTLNFHVGKLFTASTQGHDLNDAVRVPQKDLHLTIIESIGGYQLIMSGPTAAMASLPINKAYLHAMIGTLRETLLKKVVYLEAANGLNVYQQGIKIDDDSYNHTLPILANAGYDFFDKLFYGPGHDLSIRKIGDTIKTRAKKDKLNIQIFAKDFTLPWGLLYLGDDPDEPDPDMFLGLKHVIEHIPLQPQMQVTDAQINAKDGLRVGLNVNTDIDREMGDQIIGRQLEFWNKLKKENSAITVDVYEEAGDVMGVLAGDEDAFDIMYFYCHAESYHLTDDKKGGADGSQMIMSGHRPLVLKKLRRNKASLPGQPLVFINACESAKMSPEFYDGFVPYFMDKGARGVVGTECEIPALFAEEWSYRFFRRFLEGKKTIGEIFLELRQEFFHDDKNILGLLYALYIEGSTMLNQGVLNTD